VLKGGHPKSVNTALHTGPLGHTVCRCGRDERGTRSKPGDAEPQGIGAVSGWRFGRPQRQPSHSHFVIARAGRIAWCLRAQDRRGGQARECPSRRLACDRTRQGKSAPQRGKTASRGMACRRAPGTTDPESGAPPEMVPGRRRSWFRQRRPGADGARDGVGVFPICRALRPLSCGYVPPGANGAVRVTLPVDRALRPFGATQQKPLVLGPISWSEPGRAPFRKEAVSRR
jgi:hypothetical protein